MNSPLKVLCIDGEGGYGGSSRSLAAVLAHVDRSRFTPTVWCRKKGPIQGIYAGLDIPTRVVPGLPAFGAVERFSRNLATEMIARAALARSGATMAELVAAAELHDVVHFNLESLWRAAVIVRRRSCAAVTMHVRTNPIPNIFSRRQARRAAEAVDRFVFITENERSHFEALAGRSVRGEVVYNVVQPADDGVTPRPELQADQRFKVGYLANFDWSRGPDRVIDIAAAVARRGRRDILFVMAGDLSLKGHLEGLYAAAKSEGRSLPDVVAALGLADMFVFLGHVRDPERVLAAISVLLKPTRLANPWGRDIIEALGQGVPVASVGTYDRFVRTGVTGLLQSRFDAEEQADLLIALAGAPQEVRRLGMNGQAIIRDLCDGPRRAGDLMSVWEAAVRERAA